MMMKVASRDTSREWLKPWGSWKFDPFHFCSIYIFKPLQTIRKAHL